MYPVQPFILSAMRIPCTMQAGNLPLHESASSNNRPIFLSTGLEGLIKRNCDLGDDAVSEVDDEPG